MRDEKYFTTIRMSSSMGYLDPILIPSSLLQRFMETICECIQHFAAVWTKNSDGHHWMSDTMYIQRISDGKGTLEIPQLSWWVNQLERKLQQLSNLHFRNYCLALRLTSTTLKIKKEIYVYTFTSFIGELGGSLGLFVGFSFLTIFDLYEIVAKIFKSIGNYF